MRVLFVSSGNSGKISPFVREQADSLIRLGNEVVFFLIKGKGISGYLKHLKLLKDTIEKNHIKIVHAHYGFSGLLSILQTKVPVVITFHGSDVNLFHYRIFSKIALSRSSHGIFVNADMAAKMKVRKDYSIIPCGIDTANFTLLDKKEARKRLGLDPVQKYILFSSAYSRPEKNASLAMEAMKYVPGVEMIEFKGYTREECNLLLNAVDLLLMTSLNEGSPQVVKEAIACNCPVVSTDVGNVRMLIAGLKGCYICGFDPTDVAEKIKMALSDRIENGLAQIINLELDNMSVARKLENIYKGIIKI